MKVTNFLQGVVLVAAAACMLPASIAAARDDSGGLRDKLGPRFRPAIGAHAESRRPRLHRDGSLNAVERWNQIAIDTSGLDHTPVSTGDSRVFGQQLGPGRSARAMAIVHIAMFDAVNSIRGGYRGYTGLPRAAHDTSVDSAVAQAAHDTLVALYPSHKSRLDQLLAEELARLRPSRGRGESHASGIALGGQAAAAILALRNNDGSFHAEQRVRTDPSSTNPDEYVSVAGVNKWRQDPISKIPLALGSRWGGVTPFVMQNGAQFRLPEPPALNSTEYAAALDEVKRLGGTSAATLRTADQTEIGIFWAYDGMPSLCAPPRLYNQIATHIAAQQRTGVVELARLLALVNVAMADSGIAIWDSKYFHAYARPVTAICEAAGDCNSGTLGFTPLGAPASNLLGVNFTPPFPAYPSGHAGFGGALFQTLRNFYGTDRLGFEFVSDEFNGTTTDNAGNTRPLLPRRFKTLSQAEQENAHSRIYLGIHWSFDATHGIAQGNQVADYVFRNAFTPLR
jgi:hypothetical protein